MSEMFEDLKKLSEILEKGEITQAEKGFYAALFAPTAINSTGTLTVTLDKSGQHALNCYDATTDADHAIMFTVSDN